MNAAPYIDRAEELEMRGAILVAAIVAFMFPAISLAQLGSERAIPVHLSDGSEFSMPLAALVDFGERLFTAMWTSQDGAGRPFSKGNGSPLSDLSSPLSVPHDFNRLSGPDSNSCAGCHNKPTIGGGGDIVSNVFVLAQRFDFITFDMSDRTPLRGAVDEAGKPVTLQTVANSRKTVGMFGSGFIEMLSRQMTSDLQAIRDTTPIGGGVTLVTKGIGFGTLRRRTDGTWDTSRVTGLSPASLLSDGPSSPPSLIVRPFQQSGSVVSLRQFTNNAFIQHHGMEPEERVGLNVDADGDGIKNELTKADITAITIFQATLPVPTRGRSTNERLRRAVENGERQFAVIGCASCHVPALPLTNRGWIFTEPSPYNPPGNALITDTSTLAVDLTSPELPGPRLRPVNGVVWVPAYTDLKLHDITTGPGDPNREALDVNQAAGSLQFFDGNSRFITRKLWGIANQHSFGHQGLFTTMREAVLAHSGEAEASRRRFEALSDYDRDCVIEFLKSLQILPNDKGRE